MRGVGTLARVSWIVVGAVAAGTFAAEAAVKIPGCAELSAWGKELAPNATTPINPTPSRFSIPTSFASPRFEQDFGLPAVDWTADDVAAAVKATGDCANAAKKARNKDDITALTALWRGFGGLRATVGALAASEAKLHKDLQVLLDDPPSREALDALIVVASAHDGAEGLNQRAAAALKESTLRLNKSTSVHSHAQFVINTLSDLPTKSWARAFPAVDARIVTVRQWVIDDANAQINATPETVQGLTMLNRLLSRTKTELAGAFPAAELAQFDAVAAARRGAIEDALVAQQLAGIDAAPATAEGLNRLRLASQDPVRTALSPARSALLDKRIAERRESIGDAVADEQIRRLDQFPETLDGLTELGRFRDTTMRGLGELAGPAAAARFGEAAGRRASTIGEAAFGPFRKALGELPATDEGLAGLDLALQEIGGAVAGLDPLLRTRYTEAAAARRAEIAKAVEQADARLAKLPLPGGIFVDRNGRAKFEFRERNRVYVTLFDEVMEAGYDVDGDRVIVRLPGTNQVYTRQGAWIRGNGLDLKRQAE